MVYLKTLNLKFFSFGKIVGWIKSRTIVEDWDQHFRVCDHREDIGEPITDEKKLKFNN